MQKVDQVHQALLYGFDRQQLRPLKKLLPVGVCHVKMCEHGCLHCYILFYGEQHSKQYILNVACVFHSCSRLQHFYDLLVLY